MRRVSGITGGFVRHALRGGRPRADDDRGAITFIVAAMLTVMIGLAALVVDRGLVADQQRQAQAAADASALAGALVLSRGGAPAAAETEARNYAQQNFGVTPAEWTGCTTTLQPGFATLSTTPCISFNASTRAVRVNLPSRRVPSFFSGIFGVSSRTVASAATAGLGEPGANCVLCVLNQTDGQSGGIVASGGDVTVNNLLGFNNTGGIDVTGGRIFYRAWDNRGDMTPAPPVQLPSAFEDPYRNVTPPAVSGTATTPAAGTACGPGNYIDVSNCASFGPGLYVIVGSSGNQLQVNATPPGGVTFFFTCSDTVGATVTVRACKPGEKGGSFGGAGKSGATLSMTAPTTGTYRDMAIYVDPNNTADQRWVGTAELRVTGILYAPRAALADVDTRGNGQVFVTGRMVVGSLQMKGAGKDKFHISVTGPFPPGPTGAIGLVPRLSQ